MNQPQPLDQGRTFLARLFDFSFETFITTSVVRILYILFVVLAAIWALVLIIGIAAQGGVAIIGALIIAPLFFLLYVMMARIGLELVMVIFRIAADIDVIARNSERRP